MPASILSEAPHIAPRSKPGSALRDALRNHWPEYLMEAAALGTFMMSACVFGVLLEHPDAPLRQAIDNPVIRRVLAGIAMGLTAVAIICSPWGKRSGAHMNPSVTLTFYTLGKVAGWDALFYIVAQFLGGLAGVTAADLIIGPALRHSAVNYVATVPGDSGPAIAFGAEVLISFVMMSMVLFTSNSKRLSRFTPFLAGLCVATFISLEAPVSGMSMNPARSLGSAFPAQEWMFLWIYFIAPPLGMLAAAQLFRTRRGIHQVFCAKLHHHNDERCIFRCKYCWMQTQD